MTEQFIMTIEDTKESKLLLAYLKALDYVRLEKRSENKVVEEIKSSLKQVKLMQEGKLPKKSAKDFLDEL